MALIMYQIVIFFLTYGATRNLAETKLIKVKIQSVFTGQYLNTLQPFYFGTDDSVIWQIDWEAGIKNSTNILKPFPVTNGIEWRRIHVLTISSIGLGPVNATEDGDWIITSDYSSALGRYYHKFRTTGTFAPNHCINTPIEPSVTTLTLCDPDFKQQEFLLSYVE